MNLLLTFDNNYSQHAGVVMASFLANHTGIHSFYVISDSISEDNQKLLHSIVSSYHCQLSFYFVNVDIVKQFPIGQGTANTYVSIATYFRLFITEVLPESIDRILYLDCDIVIDKSIEEIAEACGFSSGNYLTLIFKQKEGISPSSYRKNRN